MVANKRITDLSDYTSVLPYASELFGVYRPMLGWRSQRTLRRIEQAVVRVRPQPADRLADRFAGRVEAQFDGAQFISATLKVGEHASQRARTVAGSVLTTLISERLQESGRRPVGGEWLELVNPGEVESMLNGPVIDAHMEAHRARLEQAHANGGVDTPSMVAQMNAMLGHESAVAGALIALADTAMFADLDQLFFSSKPPSSIADELAAMHSFRDPLDTFDPTKQLGQVTVSPIGIVHLFRQFFFELDSFLGTPVEHVWLSPGSMVELIEVSTRRSLVEKTIETSLDTMQRSETSTTDQDELSTAVKQDNKSDTKLGFSTTVNQSWGTGNATATGSLNLDTTQQSAREEAHKRTRQQTEKLSTEIRQSFKSTFRTVTETLDQSSKRYVLNNVTGDLVNYEMRRKMRQVGVQVQDVGTYLCWETFVDNPGEQLALPNLIHIAKPADLVVIPNASEIPMPPEFLTTVFTGEAVWNFPSNDSQHAEDHPDVLGRFVPLNTLDIPGIPNDYEVVVPVDPFIDIEKSVIAAGDDDSWNAANWGSQGMITADGKRVVVGITTMPKPDGLAWDQRITFKVSGSVQLRLKAAKRTEIDAANQAIRSAKGAADVENQRRVEQAYLDSVRDRVTAASKIKQRRFEGLREEERTIVYRNLIGSLMSEQLYRNLPDTEAGQELRHVMSELLNSIFDIDKMLYFVAPEWWKPRQRSSLVLGGSVIPNSIDGQSVRWADDRHHDKYFITDESEVAPLGSSLGWLLQLDGDDLRNTFLNAPWVKAVIPIRPGKELAATNWLQSVQVEGADGLNAAYLAPDEELDEIRTRLLTEDPADVVQTHAEVTISDALRALCLVVAEKHTASMTTDKFPTDTAISDDSKVSATPVEKVFEHGFYPLKNSFKAVTSEPFEVFDQWIEVLPTDQVVPVPVKYDPRTGRQLAT